MPAAKAPIYKPINVLIGARLREFRDLIPCAQMAGKLGIDRLLLVNYERGKAALPWAVFDRLWRETSCSPHWLYLGDGPQFLSRAVVELPFAEADLKHRATFPAVYAQYGAQISGGQPGAPERMAHLLQMESFLAAARAGRIALPTLRETSLFTLQRMPKPSRKIVQTK